MGRRLADVAPQLERALTHGGDLSPLFDVAQIRRETVWVSMRDGVRLATDLYLPPGGVAPAVAVRTPYDRRDSRLVEAFLQFARHGYVVISQDCRGTGDSEPDSWNYYVHEREDSFDLVEWVSKQDWFDGFLGACGGSYLAQTQWCMAFHPRMSTIVPQCGGLGIAINTARLHMFVNAYARSVGKGPDKVPVSLQDLEARMLEETLASGFFNEPLYEPFPNALLERYPKLRTLPPFDARRWLWEHYSTLSSAQRAELIRLALGESSVTSVGVESLSAFFGHQIAHDAHMFPCARPSEVCRALHAPALMITGWYDWGVNDALESWELLAREAPEPVRSQSRLIIVPSAHGVPGYHEGREGHPELARTYRTSNIVDLLLRWYGAVRDRAVESWPTVMYYLMGANEWHVASAWPPREVQTLSLYLCSEGRLTPHPPERSAPPDRYTYNPEEPTPTLGGSIVSYVYTPGSVDVSKAQQRSDVLTYTTEPLPRDIDVVGRLVLILYASSSAVDTDFSARLTDVFPDGRAIQLQSGLLRARYRNLNGEPELLQPGRIHRLEIDMWATANRFRAGHRLRLDISSADFPRFDRNSNLGGEPGQPVPATQTIYHDSQYPSHLVASVLGRGID